jgi:DNA polymerase
MEGCMRCELHRTRTKLVFGSGDPKADLMFVGEAPGEDEDRQGEPFVGKAGQLLTKMIEAMGMKRSEVYICNILKSRPPGNRTPQPHEIAACLPFLKKQIRIIRPKIICALGATAAKTLLATAQSIGALRGWFFDYEGSKLIPTFHPSYLLRSPWEKAKAWEDLKKVRDTLTAMREAEAGQKKG